jgi:hypothetical protein
MATLACLEHVAAVMLEPETPMLSALLEPGIDAPRSQRSHGGLQKPWSSESGAIKLLR